MDHNVPFLSFGLVWFGYPPALAGCLEIRFLLLFFVFLNILSRKFL
jgi:hypothetical protein